MEPLISSTFAAEPAGPTFSVRRSLPKAKLAEIVAGGELIRPEVPSDVPEAGTARPPPAPAFNVKVPLVIFAELVRPTPSVSGLALTSGRTKPPGGVKPKPLPIASVLPPKSNLPDDVTFKITFGAICSTVAALEISTTSAS